MDGSGAPAGQAPRSRFLRRRSLSQISKWIDSFPMFVQLWKYIFYSSRSFSDKYWRAGGVADGGLQRIRHGRSRGHGAHPSARLRDAPWARRGCLFAACSPVRASRSAARASLPPAVPEPFPPACLLQVRRRAAAIAPCPPRPVSTSAPPPAPGRGPATTVALRVHTISTYVGPDSPPGSRRANLR